MQSSRVTRTVCAIVLVLAAISLVSCHKSDSASSAATVSVNSDKLDRPTAEALLQKQSDTLFENDGLTMDHVTIETAQKELLDRLPDVAFLQELADAGVVQQKTEKQEGDVTAYHFAPIPQQGIKVIYPESPYYEDIIMTLATRGVKNVTGISQDGTTAEVEAEVGLVPTNLYKRILPRVQDTVAKCPASTPANAYNSSTFDPASFAVAYFCLHWPKEAEFSAVKTATFNFKKFDDGWRVVHSHVR